MLVTNYLANKGPVRAVQRLYSENLRKGLSMTQFTLCHVMTCHQHTVTATDRFPHSCHTTLSLHCNSKMLYNLFHNSQKPRQDATKTWPTLVKHEAYAVTANIWHRYTM